MIASCNDSRQPFAKTICSICYEDLKPIVEDLQAISICGHVFHELCLQQWFEYCSKGKKKCPICNQTCSSCNVSRLYFQSVGDSNDPNLTQKLQTHKQNPEELQLECRRLEGKVKGLSSTLEIRENDLRNLRNELCECKEQLKIEEASKNEALENIRSVSHLLNIKTQKLNESDLECIKLQERNGALTKELAAYKVAVDYKLDENEIVKLTSCDTKSLANRVKHYNELLATQRLSASNERRLREERDKLREKVKELKNYIGELETSNEKKDNEVLRTLKKSKKTENVSDGVNSSRIDMHTRQGTINEPCVHPRKAKRSRVIENDDVTNNENGVSSFILIDDDVSDTSATEASCLPKRVREKSKDKAVSVSNYRDEDEDVVLVHEIADDMPLPNIKKLSPPSVVNSKEGDICFSAGLIGPDGTKTYLGKWCKKAQSKGFSSSSGPRQVSGNLISVGADGRGGTIKVLKSQSQPSLDFKRSSFSANDGKFGSKSSSISLQSHGSLQINQFFQ
ncbi:uncharacterized protein [Rutidosis leptorrhynchoides]|uniref:uncharacterized protein n=1 Tax=Rutidosis leptorrhynchoides TaxID=125765 RepID=UPI003A997DEA